MGQHGEHVMYSRRFPFAAADFRRSHDASRVSAPEPVLILAMYILAGSQYVIILQLVLRMFIVAELSIEVSLP